MKHHLDFEKPIAELQARLEELKKHPEKHSLEVSFEEEVALMEKKLDETKRHVFSNLSAWDRIKIARHPKRPYTLDYVEIAFTGFSELHGDRLLGRIESWSLAPRKAGILKKIFCVILVRRIRKVTAKL
jgi:acetyl-CoA carboxylase carboxyl transferase subunit alpha